MTSFMTEDFLLDTEFARRLYHDYAKDQPIFDYHCHLPPQQVAENYRFKNLYDIWLKGDHYKWRAMRTNGVPERLCTGDASDREKFDAPGGHGSTHYWQPVIPLDPFRAASTFWYYR